MCLRDRLSCCESDVDSGDEIAGFAPAYISSTIPSPCPHRYHGEEGRESCCNNVLCGPVICPKPAPVMVQENKCAEGDDDSIHFDLVNLK